MLVQVMGALFALMEQHEGLWSRQGESQPVPLFGFPYEVGIEPVHVNVERMVAHYRQGLADLEPLWQQILAGDTITRLRNLQGTAGTDCRIPDELWVQVVYDAATAYHKRIMPRDHLLKALTPLYLGRTASFVQATQGLTSKEAEHKIEGLCRTFEHMKSYLIERWRPLTLQPVSSALLRHTTVAAGGDHG
jgi:hypothetical protein